jgi:beta-N-acetylhexosaminidase
MNPPVRGFYVALILLILIPLTTGLASPLTQTNPSEDRARELFAKLTPEEKVGQLFLVTFDGPEAGSSTKIYDLITSHHVGGVIIKAINDNLLAHDQTLPFLLTLTRQIQSDEYYFSFKDFYDPTTQTTFRPVYIPLFIGISQDGDGYPYDQILSSSITQLPSSMSVGATWKPELAQKVGEVFGRELSALGFNFLLGPDLDVLDQPNTEGTGDLGVRSFGGDPSWVGEMGRAFVTGVHQGSQGEMVVIAKHFPGYGSATRLPEDEVATVPKTLEQLRQMELVPFLAVTGYAPSAEATVDGLLTAHIRYQGLLGNKPVSMDPEALDKFLSLEPVQTWKKNGGIVVSDDLGSQAIRKFFESSGQTYTSRFVAMNAFQAGNDLLYLGDVQSGDDTDSYASILRTLEFFTQKYREDDFFAKRVDASVLRILTLKFRMYGNTFSLSKASAAPSLPSDMGRSGDITSEVIQQAATLLSPSPDELIKSLPAPPGRNDRIVFITDVRSGRQCSKCPLQDIIKKDALEQTIIRLYSRQTGGEILPGNLVSYSYEELQEMLDVGTGIVQIENDLKSATWIVFLMLDETPVVPSSLAMRRFLAERPDLLQQKKIVGFAFNAPYYLDATDVAKLSAYYGLYSKTLKSFDVAARLLMQEARLTGHLPVSVMSVGYDLHLRLQPDPSQPFPLQLDSGDDKSPTPSITPGNAERPRYKVGDSIPVRAGIILDQNGNTVADGTPVNFLITYGEGGSVRQVPSGTIQGIARAIIRVEQPGMLRIEAESSQAKSERLEYEILSETGEVVAPTFTPSPTDTPTLTPTETITPTVTPYPTPIPIRNRTNLSDWFMAMLITAGLGLAIYWAAALIGQVRWGVRGGFMALIGGLLAYCYVAANLPGSAPLVEKSGTWGVSLVILTGVILGFCVSLGWRTLQKKRI